jgi:tryptophan synthase beta chain
VTAPSSSPASSPASPARPEHLADAHGPYFGRFGGRFVPEALVAALDELDAAYARAAADPQFRAELEHLHRT